MTDARQPYHAVDLMKWICSLLVIVVHTYPFYEVLPDVGFVTSNILGRIVIPFFFVSAGYFMQIGLTHKQEGYFRSYMLRLIRLYLIWSLLYIPFGMHKLSSMMEIHGWMWLGALAVGLLNTGTYYHLWYMAALIFAMLFCWLLSRKLSLKVLLGIGAGLFLIGLFETYNGLIAGGWLRQTLDLYLMFMFTTRNGLLFGVLFVALGMFLAQHQRWRKIPHPFRLAALSFILLVIEAFSVRSMQLALDYNMYLMTVPFTLFWFCGLLQSRLDWPLPYRQLRESSTLIYFTHGFFLELGEILLGPLYLNHGAVRFFFVFPLTLICAEIIRRKLPMLK